MVERVVFDADELKNYSILMSVYTKEKPEYLRESMLSMYEQTIPTDDFVLVCDGPLNDGLDEVVTEMQEKFGERLRVFRLSENRGLGLALRFGVEKCRNELIARMDSDDIAVKNRIEKQLEVFEKKPYVSVVGSNILEYDENMNRQIAYKNVPEKNEDIMAIMKKRNPMNHMSVMFRKSKVLSAGNYLEMPFFEDYYLWVRIAKDGNEFYNIPEPLVNVRGGLQMVGRRGGIKYMKNIVRFQKVLKKNEIIAVPRLIVNVFERLAVALIPNGARNMVYTKMLRRGI